MRSQRPLRRVATAIAGHACRVLPPNRRDWGRAMSSEVESIDQDVDAMLWSFGCAFASYRERMHIMAKSILNVARWVLGLEALACLGPLTLLWIITLYTLGTTEASARSIIVPITIAAMGPIGLLLAILVVVRRNIPANLFALLASAFAASGLLQIIAVDTLWWFAFDWRVWLLNSMLPGLACAHLALIRFTEQERSKIQQATAERM